jgi:chromosomal replication initiator protein
MESIWNRTKEILANAMDPDSFQRWIAPLHCLKIESGCVELGCPNSFFKEWIENHHAGKLHEVLQEVLEQDVSVRLSLDPRPVSREKQPTGEQMSFGQLRPSPLWFSGLNGNYTFERFVVGPCNEFAYTASLEVARTPMTRYNPLLLLADVGLGKSHLSSAIGNHILQHKQQEVVFYTTAEEFINEMVQALRAKKLDTFKDKFRRRCEVLVIDGVQFLSGKAATQIELAHTLDALQNTDKRIILTSNLSPRNIPEMAESLRSRLSSGLVVDIKPPDPQTRLRILTHKAQREGVDLPEDVAEYLANKIHGNVRHLESAVIHLLAKASLLSRPVDLHLAREVVQDLFQESSLPIKPTIEEIQGCVCQHFKLDKEKMLSRSRKKSVYYPRQLAMYLCREYTDATLAVIGKAFKRNHASVIHSLAVIQGRCQTDSTIRNQIAFLTEQIRKSFPGDQSHN